ncbi:MAG: putative rane protein, partial [Anaerocolumna sp.]|nr:putative rane protein [Anaerocolumna sp.]
MSLANVFNRSRFEHLLKTLKYSFYVILHPFDGFWDLTHERRGSVGAANVIVLLVLLTTIWEMQFTNFMFYKIQWEYVNIFMVILGFIV